MLGGRGPVNEDIELVFGSETWLSYVTPWRVASK